jgi:hypothetical protein
MKQLTLLSLIVMSLTSCYHVYYAPNTANAPLLSEKSETRINVLFASGGRSEYGGGEIHLAHAVSGKFGLMANAFSVGKSEDVFNYSNNVSQTEKGNGSYAEIAVGYFQTLTPGSRWIFEAYGGYGGGGVKNEYGYSDHSKISIGKFFVQPSLGYKSKHFEIAFVPRLSLVNWKVKKEQVHSQQNIDVHNDLLMVRADPLFFSFEPAILLRAGAESFKVMAGLTISNPFGRLLTDDLIENANFSIGISINIKPTHN